MGKLSEGRKDVSVPLIIRVTYPQDWKSYNLAQSQEFKLFNDLLSDLVSNVEEPTQSIGRPKLSLRDELFCTIQKVYSQLSSRRSASLLEYSKSKVQISHKPHFNVSSKVLNKQGVTQILQELLSLTALPLKLVETGFATDSSGFRTTRFTPYAQQKYGHNKEYKWIKAHITIGVKTNIITAMEVGDAYSSDIRQFVPLIERTKDLGFKIEEAYADKAYLSRRNLSYIDNLGGVPFIPFRINSTGKPMGSKIYRQMFAMFMYNKEEFEKHYHKRSNVETTFFSMKQKLGDSLKSKNPIAQKNELLCKAIAYNILVLIQEMFGLGIKPDFSNGTDLNAN
jgi:transposase